MATKTVVEARGMVVRACAGALREEAEKLRAQIEKICVEAERTAEAAFSGFGDRTNSAKADFFRAVQAMRNDDGLDGAIKTISDEVANLAAAVSR